MAVYSDHLSTLAQFSTLIQNKSEITSRAKDI